MTIAAVFRAMAGGSFPVLVLLYTSLFGAFGTESPFFPAFLQSKGLTTSQIASVLASGTLVRLSAGPMIGATADRVGVRLALGSAAFGAAAVGLLYLPARGSWSGWRMQRCSPA